MHHSEHSCAVVQIFQQQHEILVPEQPGTPSVRQTQRRRTVEVYQNTGESMMEVYRPLEIRRGPRQQTGVRRGQRERQETGVKR